MTSCTNFKLQGKSPFFPIPMFSHAATIKFNLMGFFIFNFKFVYTVLDYTVLLLSRLCVDITYREISFSKL